MPGLSLPLLAAVALSPSDAAALDKTITAIYAPYNDPGMASAAWERPIYSHEVTRLIADWQEVVPEGEVDDLNNGDWLCQCQDWDARRFKVKITSRKAIEPDLAEVAVDIDLGFGEVRDAFLQFRREDGQWKLDELYTEEHSEGLKDALRRTIASDKSLRVPEK